MAVQPMDALGGVWIDGHADHIVIIVSFSVCFLPDVVASSQKEIRMHGYGCGNLEALTFLPQRDY